MRMLSCSIVVLAASVLASAALLRPQGDVGFWPFGVSVILAALGCAMIIVGLLEDKPR
jgi:hypothetical protein